MQLHSSMFPSQRFVAFLVYLAVFALGSMAATTTRTATAQEPTERFQRWDKNNDGKLSKRELPAALQSNFWRVDIDGDGFISPAEDARIKVRSKPKPVGEKRDGLLVQRDVSYAGNKNSRQTLDIFQPANRQDKRLPVLVFIHGGGWRKGDKKSGQNLLRPFVESGEYVGVSVGYRLSNQTKWPAQLHDCKAAIRWIRGNAKQLNIDPDRIGVWGTSAGGHLALMVGLTGEPQAGQEGKLGPHQDQNSRVACVVNWFGPTALLRMNDAPGAIDHDAENSPESLLIGSPIQQAKKRAQQASPLTFVTNKAAPVLTMHGSQDALVPLDQAQQLDAALDKAKVESTLVVIQGAGHGRFSHVKIPKLMASFLKRHLHRDSREKAIDDQDLAKQLP